jgi:glycosyltransferase involved in cell wall biosynthesis
MVTVVTPSFNYGRYIGQCLDSVRRQTYPHLEHIVRDARSTDETATVIASFAGTYQLEAIFEPDLGQADALNKAFSHARGDVLCWLNADDYWLHDRVVEDAVRELADADLVTAGGWKVNELGERLTNVAADPKRLVGELRYYDTVLQPATFWRRAGHRRLESDFHYAFDWQFFLEMTASGLTWKVVDAEWAAYRLHGMNKTMTDPSARKAEIAEILRREWGSLSPQFLWARTVYGGYRLSESLRAPFLKRGVQFANMAMWRLTRGRIFSC